MDFLDPEQVKVVAVLAAGAVTFLVLALFGIVQISSGNHPGGLGTIVGFAVAALLLAGSAYGFSLTAS